MVEGVSARASARSGSGTGAAERVAKAGNVRVTSGERRNGSHRRRASPRRDRPIPRKTRTFPALPSPLSRFLRGRGASPAPPLSFAARCRILPKHHEEAMNDDGRVVTRGMLALVAGGAMVLAACGGGGA